MIGWNYYATSPMRFFSFGAGMLLFAIILGVSRFVYFTFMDVHMKLAPAAAPDSPKPSAYVAWHFMKSEAELIGDRAVFLSAFAWAGMNRFEATLNLLSHVYVVCIAVTAVCAGACIVLMTQLGVLLNYLGEWRPSRR